MGILTPEDRSQRERRAQARGLHMALSEVRADMARRADQTLEAWDRLILRPEFRASARNLADYLALRRGDLVPFQAPLSTLGLSSLGRAGPHVRASLDAVLVSLATIAGLHGADYPPVEVFAAGPARLSARRDTLFGARADGPASRIMVTLPAGAALSPDLTEALMAAGADCLRIDCAQDDAVAWARMIGFARAAGARAGRRVPVQMDLAGNGASAEAPRVQLDFALAHADLVGLPHVSLPDDITAYLGACESLRGPGAALPVVLRIETPGGLRNLPRLIVAAGGQLSVAVMIAGGDLAAGIGPDRLGEIHEEILWLCAAAEVPLIWAPRVLAGLVQHGRSCPAEMTEAAVGQRAECVVLHHGPHVLEALEHLHGILGGAGWPPSKSASQFGTLGLWHAP